HRRGLRINDHDGVVADDDTAVGIAFGRECIKSLANFGEGDLLVGQIAGGGKVCGHVSSLLGGRLSSGRAFCPGAGELPWAMLVCGDLSAHLGDLPADAQAFSLGPEAEREWQLTCCTLRLPDRWRRRWSGRLRQASRCARGRQMRETASGACLRAAS